MPKVKLYRGDCLAILEKMRPESVDLILTDPPYGHNNASFYARCGLRTRVSFTTKNLPKK